MKVKVIFSPNITDRLKTLHMFKDLLKEHGRSKASKASVYKAFKDVLRQLNDKKLMELRRRLLLAVKAGDERAEWKLSNQIKAYLGQQLLVNPNWQ